MEKPEEDREVTKTRLKCDCDCEITDRKLAEFVAKNTSATADDLKRLAQIALMAAHLK